jgi:hypothetical protein
MVWDKLINENGENKLRLDKTVSAVSTHFN